MINILTISSWLAVPHDDYLHVYAMAWRNAPPGPFLDERSFYKQASDLADARNEFHGNDQEFKKQMIQKKHYHYLIDFINLHYGIRQFYSKQYTP